MMRRRSSASSRPSAATRGTGCVRSSPRKIATLCVFKRCNLPHPAAEPIKSEMILIAADVNGRSRTVRLLPAGAHHLSYRCSVLYCFAASGESRSEQSPAGEENEGTQCVPEAFFAAAMQDSEPPAGCESTLQSLNTHSVAMFP